MIRVAILALAMLAPPKYEYSAIVTDVYDGDTITCDVSLGFNIWLRGEKFRLIGINAPEVRGAEREAGLKSRDWLREKILGKEVTIRTVKDRKGKYGRWLAHVYTGEPGIETGFNPDGIAREMVGLGLAIEQQY